MSGHKNDVTYAATVAFAVATMRELGWMPPSNTSTDPPQDDLIERLRAVKWEVTDDCGRMPDDPTHKCVFVDMRPDDFRALLREAADALEAAREDAERLAFLANEPIIEGFVGVEKDIDDYAFDAAEEAGRDEPNEADMLTGLRRLIDAAIDQARGKAGQEVGNG